MSKARLWILLDNKLVLVSAGLDRSLANFFKDLQEDGSTAQHIPVVLSHDNCQFYRLENPVSTLKDDEEVKRDCLETSNRVLVAPRRMKVHELAEMFDADYVYLVIDFPNLFEKSNEAIGKLREEHATLFKCLQVTVESLGYWRQGDVGRNLQGGILTDSNERLPPAFRELQEALATKRAVHEQERDFHNAHIYQTHFNRIFAPPETEPHSVLNDREFAAFYNVLRCYDEDVHMLARESSSALKAGNFTVHFIQPPFFSGNGSSRGFKYQPEKSWDFPIFVDAALAPNVWWKFTPRSDWVVNSPAHKIPFVVSEVISQKQEYDRSRMLVQAIAIARAGKFLLQSTSTRAFFVVAIYVNAAMVASRYIVMQTGRGNAGHMDEIYHNMAVCIHKKDFDLTKNEEEVDFLREMYNLATQIAELSRDLDELKKGSLTDIKNVAAKVMSLSSKYPKTKTSGSTAMGPIAEGREGPSGPQDEDDLGVFEAEDIQNVLHQMNYKIGFIPWGHPHLAVIVSKTSEEHGYLKFVEREREVNVLKYLTEIESPSNHTISDVRFWPVQGGTVISMPVAGGWLTSLDNPGEKLWSVALQLFEAVAFMHEHHVAHMDLKPQNVIIPSTGGRLSIIDFSVSIRVRAPDVKYTGVIGTEDYMAPEVREGQYKPMLADLWSCGRTLEELCSCCGSSVERTTLLEITRRLMSRDPEVRPDMSTVLEWMAPPHRGKDKAASPTLGSFPTVSPLSA